MGNHDHYGREDDVLPPHEYISVQLASAGVQVLLNESVTVAGVRVCGLEDLWSWKSRPEVDTAMDAFTDGGKVCLFNELDNRVKRFYFIYAWPLMSHLPRL